MARITAIHALGDIWSMGASPQAASMQVILPDGRGSTGRNPARDHGGRPVGLAPEGADIVGGHTSLGAELTIGFTVTGLSATPHHAGGRATGQVADPDQTDRHRCDPGRRDGRARAGPDRGRRTAFDEPPAGAGSAASGAIAHAMTDVTGLALAGHLLSMLEASVSPQGLILGAVPLLPGAEMLAQF